MTKRVWVIAVVLVMISATMAACSTGGSEITLEPAASGDQANASAQQAAAAEQPASQQAPALANATDSAAAAAATGGAVAQAQPGQTGSVGVVDVTPMSEAELAAQGAGSSAPGGPAAGSSEAGQSEPGEGDTQSYPQGWTTYTDSAYGFSLEYPQSFQVAQASPALFSQLAVPPAASVYIMDPAIAESALAGTDAPDLEIRIHESGQIASLESWLATVGLTTADAPSAEVYQGASASGLKVCESTMIVPNCSVFFAGNGRVYQLRPLTQEGETMVSTFRLTQ